jgi:hypothetical protein
VLDPDVTGFAFDCFDRTPELIALGESSMRAALPELKALLDLPDIAEETAEVDLAFIPDLSVGPAQPPPGPAV